MASFGGNNNTATANGLCAAGCGFFGNAQNGGFCSKCYKERMRTPAVGSTVPSTAQASSAANVPALSESSLGGSAMDVEQGPTGAPAMVPATPPPAAASQGLSSVASAAAGRSEEASSGSLPPLSMAQSGSAVLPPFAPSPLPTPSDGATAVGAHPSLSLGGTLPSLASSTAGQATQGSAAAAGGLPPLVSPALQGATPAVTVEQGSVAPFGQGAGGGAADPTVQVNKSKCWSCKKKVGLTGFECKCAYVFCAAHRHADTHNCSFDYKSDGKALLEKLNPKIQAAKVDKL